MQTKDKLILHHSFWEKRHCIPRKPGFLSSGLILSILTGLPLRIESTRRVRRCKCPVYLRGVELLMVKFYDHVIVIRIFIRPFLWNIKYSGTDEKYSFLRDLSAAWLLSSAGFSYQNNLHRMSASTIPRREHETNMCTVAYSTSKCARALIWTWMRLWACN